MPAAGPRISVRPPQERGRQAQVSAYGLEREYRVMKALADTPAVPVPAVHGFCADESVLGTPFYIMDYVARPLVDRFQTRYTGA